MPDSTYRCDVFKPRVQDGLPDTVISDTTVTSGEYSATELEYLHNKFANSTGIRETCVAYREQAIAKLNAIIKGK